MHDDDDGLDLDDMADGAPAAPAARQAWHVWRALRNPAVAFESIGFCVAVAWRALFQRQAREQSFDHRDLQWWHLARYAGRVDCYGHPPPRWVHRALATSIDLTDAEVRLGWWKGERDAYCTGLGWSSPRARRAIREREGEATRMCGDGVPGGTQCCGPPGVPGNVLS